MGCSKGPLEVCGRKYTVRQSCMVVCVSPAQGRHGVDVGFARE